LIAYYIIRAMATDWTRLEKLNNGEKIYYTEPHLDRGGEVWFWDAKSNVKVSSDGKLAKNERVPALPGRLSGRHTLYIVDKNLVVDIEVYGDRAILRRGLLNGDLVTNAIASAEIDGVLARYRGVGFRDGTPWNATPQRVTVREYRKGGTWVIQLDGNVIMEDWRWNDQLPCRSRDAAIAAMEQRIAAKRKLGYVVRLIELNKAQHKNPKPAVPKGEPKPPKLAKRPTFPAPKNPYAAVDTAIAMLRDLHARIPEHHFIAELVDAKADRMRIAASEGHTRYFTTLHRERLNRWRAAKPGTPKRGESSWQYFLRTYGSITWILGGEVDEGLDMFYCSNVSGGGWSCLEIGADLYPIKELARALRNPELTALDVFAGGWHDDKSFAFDTRTTSRTGEHPIVPFGEGDPKLARAGAKPVPFGLWLHARVNRLTKLVERNLRDIA
jgi:hypothetical protein